jgi:hypothetical protein
MYKALGSIPAPERKQKFPVYDNYNKYYYYVKCKESGKCKLQIQKLALS